VCPTPLPPQPDPSWTVEHRVRGYQCLRGRRPRARTLSPRVCDVCDVCPADGGPDPIYPADFEGFLNHPFHEALAVVGEMRPSVDISVAGTQVAVSLRDQ
jgi:hypothetical protein